MSLIRLEGRCDPPSTAGLDVDNPFWEGMARSNTPEAMRDAKTLMFHPSIHPSKETRTCATVASRSIQSSPITSIQVPKNEVLYTVKMCKNSTTTASASVAPATPKRKRDNIDQDDLLDSWNMFSKLMDCRVAADELTRQLEISEHDEPQLATGAENAVESAFSRQKTRNDSLSSKVPDSPWEKGKWDDIDLAATPRTFCDWDPGVFLG